MKKNNNDQSIKDLLKHGKIAASESLGECPSEEQLMYYHLGELPKEEMDAVLEHTAVCSHCLSQLQSIIQFIETDVPEDISQEPESEKEWGKFISGIHDRQKSFPESLESSANQSVVSKEPSKTRLIQFSNPSHTFAAAVFTLLILAVGGLKWHSYSLKPPYWDNPDYHQLLVLKDEITRGNVKSGTMRTTLEDAKIDIQQNNYSAAKANLEEYIQEHPDDWNGFRLLGVGCLLDAREKFVFDFYYNPATVAQAISYLHLAQDLAEGNVYAQEDLFWLLGQAYLMQGEFENAAQAYQSILQLQHPGLIRQNDAKKFLNILHNINFLPQSPVP